MSDQDAAAVDGPPVAASDRLLARVVREESARIVAALSARLGSFDVAEEAVAEAVEEALRAWRSRGVPPNPGAWLTAAARHNAFDRLRREKRYREKLSLLPDVAPSTNGEWDERLPLLFGCCHPALAPDAQLALTLRAVVGLTTAQIARATLTSRATTAQRLVRAKHKMAAAGIALRLPGPTEWAGRVDVVLAVISAMYASAHLAAEAGADADRDLADDAVWLARVVADALDGEPEALGLVALLEFHRAREAGRAVDGELVLLGSQDRSKWDAAMLGDARRHLARASMLRRPGRWQLHAAIAACHADATSAADTDWLQILTLYDLLLGHDPSPLVRLNRAVALSRVEGAEVALAELHELAASLDGSHLWHAVRAELLREAGRGEAAIAADLRALELTANHAEQRLLRRRLDG